MSLCIRAWQLAGARLWCLFMLMYYQFTCCHRELRWTFIYLGHTGLICLVISIVVLPYQFLTQQSLMIYLQIKELSCTWAFVLPKWEVLQWSMFEKISRSPQLECYQVEKNVGRKSQVEGSLQARGYTLGKSALFFFFGLLLIIPVRCV